MSAKVTKTKRGAEGAEQPGKRSKSVEPAAAERLKLLQDLENFIEECTYWEEKGEKQDECDDLHLLIDVQVTDLLAAEKNNDHKPSDVYKHWRNISKPNIVRFYRADLFYNDIYNNGGGNIVLKGQEDEFHELFPDIKCTSIANFVKLEKNDEYKDLTFEELGTLATFYRELESSMTRIINEAFEEQKDAMKKQ